MSSPPASPRVREYLQKQLARNPWEESDQIVSARAAALRLKAKTPPPAEDLTEKRVAARETLDKVRTAAFTADAATLQHKLASLQLDDFPDLMAAAARLNTILRARKKLPALTQHPDFNADFFNCFKEVLVSPARDTAVLRERVLASFGKRKLRTRGRKMIALLQSELPELCALESDWLAMLAKGGKPDTGQFFDSVDMNIGDVPRWVWVLLVILLSSVLRNAFRDSEPATNRKSPSRASAPSDPAPTPNLSQAQQNELIQRGAEVFRRQQQEQRLEEHPRLIEELEERSHPGLRRAYKDLSIEIEERRRQQQVASRYGKVWNLCGSVNVTQSFGDWVFEFGASPSKAFVRDMAPLPRRTSFAFNEPTPEIARQLEEIAQARFKKDRPTTADKHGKTPEELRLEMIQTVRELHAQHLAGRVEEEQSDNLIELAI